MNFLLKVIIIISLMISLTNAVTFSMDEKSLDELGQMYDKGVLSRIHELLSLMNRIEKENDYEKLKQVNNFFNNIKFQSDLQTWNLKDYWATRTEFLGVDEGDCEDYVIAKYFTLVQLGIDPSQLYLTYVKAIKYRQSHMVLSYYPKNQKIPLILDNINPEILLATKRRDLHPVFNFNVQNIYMAKQRGLGRKVPMGKNKLNKLTDIILKIKKERE